jgi:uncharacterized membrane protein
MDDLVFARTLHLLGVVIWIGGMAMATAVAIPAARRGELGDDRLRAFEAIEGRFIWYARASVLIVGITGYYMTDALDLWDRFFAAEFWWMHAMVCLWLLFAAVLFVLEPLVLHRYFARWATENPDAAFAWLQRAHWVMLALALITVFGAAAGSHGWSLL